MILKLLQSATIVFVTAIAGVIASMTININFDVNEHLEYLNERQDNQERIRLLEKIPKDDSNIQVLISCPDNDSAQCNQNIWIVDQATLIIDIESETGFFITNVSPAKNTGIDK